MSERLLSLETDSPPNHVLQRKEPARARSDGPGGQLADLYRREALRLTRNLRRQTGDHDAAIDLVQEAFTRLCAVQHRGTIHSVDAYLRRIVRNLLTDRWRRHHAPPSVALDMIGDVGVPADQGLDIEVRQSAALINRALAELTPRCREVFLMHRDLDMRYADIGAALGITTSTVEYHMTRALAHLSRELFDR